MAFIPAVVGTSLLTYVGSLRGQEVINTFHVQLATPEVVDVAHANLAFDAFRDAFVDSSAPFALSTQYTLNSVTMKDLEVEDGALAVSTSTPSTGVATGACLPNEVALCLTKRSAFSGRSFRGRMYLAGIPVSATDGTDLNRLDAAHVTTANTAAAAFLAALNAADMVPVITSYVHDKAPRVEAVNSNIIGINANARLDSQRRRMPRS